MYSYENAYQNVLENVHELVLHTFVIYQCIFFVQIETVRSWNTRIILLYKFMLCNILPHSFTV